MTMTSSAPSRWRRSWPGSRSSPWSSSRVSSGAIPASSPLPRTTMTLTRRSRSRSRGISKPFGRFPALNDVSLAAARRASSWRCWARRAPARPRCCGCWPASRRPTPARCASAARTSWRSRRGARRVGMVFQHYALFRHMTVAAEHRLRPAGARRAPSGRPAAEITRPRRRPAGPGAARRAWASAIPAQLSGGQRQRVALARALAIEPRMLLLDEPFGALDAKVRRDLRRWLREMHDRAGVTTVFVTHDQEEALDLADRVAILQRRAADPARHAAGALRRIRPAPSSTTSWAPPAGCRAWWTAVVCASATGSRRRDRRPGRRRRGLLPARRGRLRAGRGAGLTAQVRGATRAVRDPRRLPGRGPAAGAAGARRHRPGRRRAWPRGPVPADAAKLYPGGAEPAVTSP